MLNDYVLIFLLAHLLGDYYCQSETMAKRKEKEFKWVLLHCLEYAMVSAAVGALSLSLDIFGFAMLLAGLHCVVDILKFFIWTGKGRRWKYLFQADQLAHLACIAAVSYICVRINVLEVLPEKFVDWGLWDFGTVLKATVALLAIFKPANITIQAVMGPYKMPSDNEGTRSAGKLIGILERLIILVLMYLGQYGAIGLVLTAKSITRYDKISKDPGFAEYYLLGTLLSTIYVLLTYVLVVGIA